MLLKFLPFLLITCINGAQVKYIVPNEVVTMASNQITFERFQIFCYKGKPKSIFNLWQSIIVNIETNGALFNHYVGDTPESVLSLYESQKSLFSLSFLSSQIKTENAYIKLNAFNQSCIGIECKVGYKLKLQIIRLDYWKIQLLLGGIFLYTFANTLSRSVLFNYICGVLIGITSSFMISLYIISKLFPRKSVMYGVFVTGWTVSLYFLQLIKDNIRIVLEKYRTYLIYYTIISGIVSFLVCYRWGPIRDERTRNIIKWSLQALGVVAMFFSTEYEEAAGALITAILIIYHTPRTWLSIPKKYFARKFPPKIKKLTMEEYYIQGMRETDKSLRELRSFCVSPECDQWKMALKLRNVKRFASFVSGESHVTDEEKFFHRSVRRSDEDSDLSWSPNDKGYSNGFDDSPIENNIGLTDDEDEDDD